MHVVFPSFSSWWFQTLFMFIPISGNDPIWLRLFDGLKPPTSKEFLLRKAGVTWIMEYPYTQKSGSHRGWVCFAPIYPIHLPGDYKSGLEMCPQNVNICLFPGLAALVPQNCKPHRADPMNLHGFFTKTALGWQREGTVPHIQKESPLFFGILPFLP